MLKIISGAARSGKTRRVLEEIKASPRDKIVLLTPEQNSHNAERDLALVCGAGINLRAEVLSFTRLASRVFTQLGGAADIIPDRASKLLLMSLAVSAVSDKLQIYSSRERQSDFLKSLLDTREELARTVTGAERLAELSRLAEGDVAKKLSDLSLICAAFDALLARSMSDPRERLERLADLLPQSDIGSGGFYIDGFTDFTALELAVIDSLLRRGGDVTVTLCRDGGESPAFAVADATFHTLVSMAKKRSVPLILETAEYLEPGRSASLARLCAGLFDHQTAAGENDGSVEIVAAESVFSECELAAGRILSWMKQDEALRWRDIAVAARDFSAYESLGESVFALCGVPIFTDRREDVSRLGVFSLALAAVDAALSWQREDIFRCLKTGLAGLEPGEVNELENYCATWTIRGESAWKRAWGMSPRGFAAAGDEKDAEQLERLNSLRLRVFEPLSALFENLGECRRALDFSRAIYNYFEAIGLSETLTARANELRRGGKNTYAEQLLRSWELMISALERFAAALGERDTNSEECFRLFTLLVSQLSAGSIPTALDSVSFGELSRLRGRRIKKLIILGADEGSLPMLTASGGVFSREERRELAALGLELSSVRDEELCREFWDVYSALSAASESLYISYNSALEPSFVISRALALCGAKISLGAALRARAAMQSGKTLFRLALSGDASSEARAARVMANELWGDDFSEALKAVNAPRGSLGEKSVRELYGRDFHMTASRAEKFSVCRFAYFMRYGLRAKKRAEAAMDAPEFGNFIHYILENTAREVKNRGGFKALDSKECAEIAEGFISRYINEIMRGFEGKSRRFIYLFSRLKSSVMKIVADLAEEFASSDFEPIDFELDFSPHGDLEPISLDIGGEKMNIEGKVDRVDGWLHGDKLYLRVADYKTGRTSFSLTDVWYGKGIQMLIYLFALGALGEKRYGKKTVPAGVLYSPARDVLLSAPRSASEEYIAKLRQKSLSRTGIILNDPEVIDAMENGDNPVRIPVSFKGGTASGSIASAEQLGALARHVERTLAEIGREIKSGSIAANPLKNSAEDPCAYCEFAAACDFREDMDKARIKAKIPENEFWEKLRPDNAV